MDFVFFFLILFCTHSHLQVIRTYFRLRQTLGIPTGFARSQNENICVVNIKYKYIVRSEVVDSPWNGD